jgi:hypothetical protein
MSTCLQTDGSGLVVAKGSPAFGLDDFTLETWIKPTAAGVIMSNKSTEGGNQWEENAGFVFSVGADGALHIAVDNGQAFYAVDSAPTMLFDGNWHHVTSGRSGFDLHLFMDGQELQTTTNNSGTADSMSLDQTASLALSARPEAVDFMAGYFSEARVWTIFLTVAQIQANMYTRLTGKEAGLVILWPFSSAVVDELTGAYPSETQGNCTFPTSDCPIDNPPPEEADEAEEAEESFEPEA